VAVDETIRAVRRACPDILVGVSTGAWIENDEARTRNAIAGWHDLPDYASVNLSETDAPAVMALLGRRGIGIEAGLASVADAERFLDFADHGRVFRILIEIAEQDMAAALGDSRLSRRHARRCWRAAAYPASRLRCDGLAICRRCPSTAMVHLGWVEGRQASPRWHHRIRQRSAGGGRGRDLPEPADRVGILTRGPDRLRSLKWRITPIGPRVARIRSAPIRPTRWYMNRPSSLQQDDGFR
jgi:hypothetical protein